MLDITLILYNLRSTYNVGSILRTADAAGVTHVIAVGTTPYPELSSDTRPPHVRDANTRAIAKVALGAEQTMDISYMANIKESLSIMQDAGKIILALEQAEDSVDLFEYIAPSSPVVLIVGPEVTGIEPEVLEFCDQVLEIPMHGQKESLNVGVATGIALYKLQK